MFLEHPSVHDGRKAVRSRSTLPGGAMSAGDHSETEDEHVDILLSGPPVQGIINPFLRCSLFL